MGDVGAFEVVHDRQVAGNHVDDGTGHEEWRYLANARGNKFSLGFLDQWQAADPGADGDADPFRINGMFFIETSITDSLNAGSHAKMDKGIHATGIFG